jgi:methionyl-tRNA formyltransferase
MPGMSGLVFFGTPEFAVPTLAALVESGRAPLLVVTQPARAVGRGRQMHEPPVATWARRHGLPVDQPERVRDEAFLDRLRELAPDLAVVVAFGQIFRRPLLELPRLGCVNVHASLLPRWRGAAPIQAAIAAADAVTGVTTMLMGEGLDSGPLLLSEETAIAPGETAEELSPRLAAMGAALLVRTVEGLERGDITPRPQDESLATYAPRLRREDGRVDWSLDAESIAARWRAYTPWPALESTLRGDAVKLARVRSGSPPSAAAAPGELLGLEEDGVRVACGRGTAVAIGELQRAGRRALSARDFWNGERLRAGERFG